MRGGRRLAKKSNMAETVRLRLVKWSEGLKDSLWKDAVDRAKRPMKEDSPKKQEADNTAWRLGFFLLFG